MTRVTISLAAPFSTAVAGSGGSTNGRAYLLVGTGLARSPKAAYAQALRAVLAAHPESQALKGEKWFVPSVDCFLHRPSHMRVRTEQNGSVVSDVVFRVNTDGYTTPQDRAEALRNIQSGRLVKPCMSIRMVGHFYKSTPRPAMLCVPVYDLHRDSNGSCHVREGRRLLRDMGDRGSGHAS